MEKINYNLVIPSNETHKIPARSGIYVLSSAHDNVLYAGKSLNLRSRVRGHLNGSTQTRYYSNQFHVVSLIFHDDLNTLDGFETDVIHLLKPHLNNDKAEYDKPVVPIDPSPISDDVKAVRCMHTDIFNKTCSAFAQESGFCFIHDHSSGYFPWIQKGKLITSEMKRLIHGMEHKKKNKPMYFYMSRETFSKLLKENTFVDFDMKGYQSVPKFKQHYIVIDDIDEIRLERYGRL